MKSLNGNPVVLVCPIKASIQIGIIACMAQMEDLKSIDLNVFTVKLVALNMLGGTWWF